MRKEAILVWPTNGECDRTKKIVTDVQRSMRIYQYVAYTLRFPQGGGNCVDPKTPHSSPVFDDLPTCSLSICEKSKIWRSSMFAWCPFSSSSHNESRRGAPKLVMILLANRMDDTWSWAEWQKEGFEECEPLDATAEMSWRFRRKWEIRR